MRWFVSIQDTLDSLLIARSHEIKTALFPGDQLFRRLEVATDDEPSPGMKEACEVGTDETFRPGYKCSVLLGMPI